MTRQRLIPKQAPALAAVVAVALVLGPSRSAEPGTPPVPDNSQRTVELLDKIEKRLAAQQATTDVVLDIVRTDLKSLRDEVSRLRQEVTDLRAKAAAAPAISQSNYPST